MTLITIDASGAFVGDEIDTSAFGGEYLGWTGFPGWQVQAEHIGIHHIRWPAGIIAEDRIEANGYAFDISTPTLVDNWPKSNGFPREGLAEMFAYANEENASFAMIVPTGRYVDVMSADPAAARAWIASDVAAFTARLFSGDFGPIPPDFILEIGAEYYSTDVWATLADNPNAEGIFAEVFAELVAAFRDAEAAHGSDVYSLAVQAARFQSWDDTAVTQDGELDDAYAFLAAYEAIGVESAIDALIWHRYVYTFEQTAHHLTPEAGEHTLTDHLALWEAELVRPLDLVLSWAAPDIDRNGEYPTDPFFDFGPRAAHSTLQMFSELVEAGADYATLYGIDSQWTGAVSTGTTNANVYSVSFHGEVYGMMAESLVGLTSTDAFHENLVLTDQQNAAIPTDHVNVFGFSDGVGREVTFAAVWDLASAEVELRFAAPAVASDYVAVTHLVPDSFDSDAGGVRVVANASINLDGSVIVGDVGDYEVVRVVHSSALDLLETDQTILSQMTGRGLVALSDTEDVFSFDQDLSNRVINAHDGDDLITGSSMSDIILGGSGSDMLSGGEGGDFLVGDEVLPQAFIEWLAGDSFEYF